jgi:quercetin dioxygenase-like cupin family protein
MASRNTLPLINRYITTHSESGCSVLESTIPSPAIWRHIPEASFFLGYVTKSFPIDLKDDADLVTYTDAYGSPPKVTYPGGTVLRVMDLAPGKASPMHRTVSLDYCVVLEGVLELALDSGETQLMKRGDMCVQRATMHEYRNTSQTEWARMLMVYVDSTKPVVGGKELGESMVSGEDPNAITEDGKALSESMVGGREV